MFTVKFTNKSNKQYQKLERAIRNEYTLFLKGIRDNPFLGKLAKDTYHAHIKYHWVAVWTVDEAKRLITVTYIGSREDAPY